MTRVGRADRVIENPILNRPYDEPSRHFAFDVDGITDEVVERRRPSSYFTPVPPTRKGGQQLELTELTADQIRRNDLVDRIRYHVGVWRGAGYPNVSPTTKQLLELERSRTGQPRAVLPARSSRNRDLPGGGGAAQR